MCKRGHVEGPPYGYDTWLKSVCMSRDIGLAIDLNGCAQRMQTRRSRHPTHLHRQSTATAHGLFHVPFH